MHAQQVNGISKVQTPEHSSVSIDSFQAEAVPHSTKPFKMFEISGYAGCMWTMPHLHLHCCMDPPAALFTACVPSFMVVVNYCFE